MGEVFGRRWRAVLLPCLVVAVCVAGLVPGTAAAATGAGSITGTISDAAGPVNGAFVRAYDAADDSTTAETAADGTYTLSDLPSGSYVVEASGPEGSNDITTYNGNTEDQYTTTHVAVTDPNPTPNVNITLASGGSVSGTITGTNGAGIPGVEVYLTGAGIDSFGVGGAETAANGTYTISGVPAGTYYADIDPSASDVTNATNYTAQYYGAAGGTIAGTEQASGAAVSVTAGATATVNQALVVGAEITGTITDAGGAGGLIGEVDAETASGTDFGFADSAATGAYTIYGLPSGTFYLDFTGPWTDAAGTTVNDADGWLSGSGLAESQQTSVALGLTAGGTAVTANETLPAAGAIDGTVTGNGSPLSGVTVELYDSAGNLVPGDSAGTGEDGVYAIQDLPPGAYKVAYLPNGYGDATGAGNLGFQFFNGVSTLAAATPVNVAAGMAAGSVNAALTTGGTITGTVTSAATAAGLPDVEVLLLDASGNMLDSTSTRGDGTYSITGVPTGSYDVEFIPPAGTAVLYQLQYFGGKQVLTGSTPVTVTGGQTTASINAALVTSTQALEIPRIVATAPIISGTAKVGDKLTAKVKGWTPGTAFSYQWSAGGKAIAGATSSTFTLVAADVKRLITVTVTGKQSGYVFATASSAKTKLVAVGTLKTVVPKISGTVAVGRKLTVKTGKWTKGAKLTIQWYANHRKIKKATRATFTLAAAEHGKKVTVKVTGRLKGYKTVVKTSRQTKQVAV